MSATLKSASPGKLGDALVATCLLTIFLLKLLHITDVARTAARIISCSSNIKQLTQEINLYVQDWDDHLPPASSWIDATQASMVATQSTLPSIHLFRCPDFPQDYPGLGLAYNSHLSHRRRKEISDPATTPLLYDSNLLQKNAHAPGSTGLADPPRHHDHTKNAIGFLDGHVQQLLSSGSSP